MAACNGPARPLAGRVALVTGGARGIGKATAAALAAAGADVALLDLDAPAARAAAREIARATGRRAVAAAADVTRAPPVRRAVERTVARLGRLDILVNNAGVWEPGGLCDVPPAAWDRVFAVNVRGALLATQAAVPAMRVVGQGKIVNIASAVGLQPAPAWSAYCVSRAAAVMLSRVAAVELATANIQVHCLCPGAVRTDLSRRITLVTGDAFPHALEPQEVGAAVVEVVVPFEETTTGRVLILYRGGREEAAL